ncbi:MAG: hypothetical protein V3U67_01185 [Gemmatimonadota bacterium]
MMDTVADTWFATYSQGAGASGMEEDSSWDVVTAGEPAVEPADALAQAAAPINQKKASGLKILRFILPFLPFEL